MSSRRTAHLVALAATTSLLFAAGCGSSGDSNSSATTTAAPASTAAPTTVATTKPAAEVKAEVTANYKTFFDNFKGDPALLEDGDQLANSMDGLRSNPAAATVKFTINDVTVLSDAQCEAAAVASPCAAVKFDMGVGDNPKAVADQTGYAVYQAGKWKVAKTTFCTLVGMSGTTPKEC